jgi:hypothetical protein
MPQTPPSPTQLPVPTKTPRSGASFRRRYDELERHRTALIERLSRLGDRARQDPSYRRAMRLLNETFRKSTLAQRVGVLQAASWLLDIMERLTIGL